MKKLKITSDSLPKVEEIERKKYYFNGSIEFGHYPKNKEKEVYGCV